METPSKTIVPVICIDMKKKRLRIHRQTFHLLANPDYIQLLINPLTGILGIRGSFREDHLAHRVNKYQVSDDNCYEIYSSVLIEKLQHLYPDLNEDQSYRIYGKMITNVGLATFPMAERIAIGEEKNE